MFGIIPCRNLISDRFPIASFVVHVPNDRLFEVVCTTDPELLRGDQRHRRTPTNFASSRFGGLLRAPSGQSTYLVPPDQLRSFAGNRRLYYAVGSYAGSRGQDPTFTIDPRRPDTVPSIQLAADFGGRSLARERLSGIRYGAPVPASLEWGGDLVPQSIPSAGRVGGVEYDDGFDDALWTKDDDESDDESDDDEEDLDGAEDGRAFALEDEEESDRSAWEDDGERYGGAQRSAFGDPTAEQPVSPPSSPTASFPPRHSNFSDNYGPQPQLPERSPQPAGTRALTAADRLQILDVIAPLESGKDGFGALSVDPRDGLAWGLLRFDQRQGRLGAVLEACWLRDRDAFVRVFGEHETALRETTTATRAEDRMRPVGGALLTDKSWQSRFREASAVPAFQAAQRETADRRIFMPALSLVAWLGLDSQRALAVVFDRCVHMGIGAAANFIVSAISPIRDQARRTAALAQLGLKSLEQFQATVPGLPSDGSWTADTHAALLHAVGSPAREAALFRLLTAAQRQSPRSSEDAAVAARITSLCTSPELSDDLVFQVTP